jgi:hypothetical protein
MTGLTKAFLQSDGVTIAKEYALKDPDENLGAPDAPRAAERTGEAVGDGTTTSTLVAHAIITEGVGTSPQVPAPSISNVGSTRAARSRSSRAAVTESAVPGAGLALPPGDCGG